MEMSNRVLDRGKFGWPSISGSDHLIRLPSRDVKGLAPIFNAKPHSINLDPYVGGGVSSLHTHCGPMAVVFLIVPIIILSINRMTLGWPKLHVRKKILKAIQPALAYLDPPTAISVEFWIIWVDASILHSGPNPPLRRMAFAMKIFPLKRIYPQHGCSAFTGQTTATKRSFTNIGRGYDAAVSTVAPTFPHRVTGFWGYSTLKHNKTTMAHTSKIKSAWHFLISPFDRIGKLGYIGRIVNGRPTDA